MHDQMSHFGVCAARLAESGAPARGIGLGGTAIADLLDCCPPDFRAYRVLRNHPVVLAQFATQLRQRPTRGVTAADWLRCAPACVNTSSQMSWGRQPRPGSSRDARLARTRRLRDARGGGSARPSLRPQAVKRAEDGTWVRPHFDHRSVA